MKIIYLLGYTWYNLIMGNDIETLQALLKEDPSNFQARRELSFILVNNGFNEEAEGNLEYLCKYFPEDAELHYNLGIVYEKLKKFEKAKEAGVPFTIHAGEAAGPESVRTAVGYGAKRIGHGVRSYEDPEVVRLLKENEVTLELCPTSNRQTHAIENMDAYPLIDYLNEGIRVTLNTDDMGIEGTTLPEEFRDMEDRFGLTDEQRMTLLENAVEAAFTTEEVRNDFREKLGITER